MGGQEAQDREPVDPIEFLRRALAISPEDAKAVREDAARKAVEREDPAHGQHGPDVGYGDETKR